MNVVRSLLATWPGRALAGAAVVVVVVGVVIAPRLGSSAPAAQIRTAPVTRASVTQTVAISGAVDAAASVRLGFTTGGRLAEVLVRIGQSVVAGQPLARLDTTDLQIALRQAETNLMSAQARYEETVAGATAEDIAIAKNSLEGSRRTYAQTKRTTQSDIAEAERSLARTRTAYLSAKTTFAALAGAVRADALTYQAAVTAIRADADGVRASLEAMDRDGDVASAVRSLESADIPLGTAVTYANGTLLLAAAELGAATEAVLLAVQRFDAAIDAGSDTTLASAAYQWARANYQTAANRLTSALDAPGGQLTAAQTNVSSAYAALRSEDLAGDTTTDEARADLVALQVALTSEQQLASSIKSRLSQSTSELPALADAITGGYVGALAGYATAEERAASSLSSQEIALRSAELSYRKTSAPPTATEITSALATLQSQEIAVERARNDLAGATLRAPTAGVVASIAGQAGEFVSSGGAAGFMVIANTSALVLHGTVGETEVAKLELGQVATVIVDAVGTGATMTGRLTALDPVATIQQGVPVYGVDVQIDIPDRAVRAGMSGTATVIVASKPDVLTVPNLAIRSQAGRRFVQVLREGKVEDAEVAFGISNESVTEVSEGLEEGDQVVLPQPRAATTQQQNRFGGPVPAGGAAFR